MSLEPTFYGYVATSNDALLIFEACRGNQILQKVSRRPHDRERDRLIKSGNIFVFDEQSSGIRRWTDGVAWSPSRILGNYLIYRQLERPLQPGEKKRAHKNRLSNGGQRDGSDHPELDSPERIKSDISPVRSPSPREAGGPIRTHAKKIKSDSSSNASDNGSVPASGKPRRWSEEQEKELAGSLTDSYGFKEGGLIKKTMSVEYEGSVHHLVSYYTIDDVMLSRLPLASQDPRLADLVIGSDLMTRTNFRVHPNSEAGPTVSRNSPTQQRTQMLLQHQRRDDPRQGPGYGPMGYNAPPPVHGGMPPEGYADPNNHYAYGPGPQPPYHRGYYPPQPTTYQPIFVHGAPPPPHMVNAPYYGPQLQGPPQYPPGPPQHPPHQPVEVKREGPPNAQYYGAYNPYTPTSSHQSTQQQMYSGHYPPRGPPPPQQQQQPPQIMNQRPYEPQGYQPNNQGENRPAAPAPQQQRFEGPPQPQNQNTTGGSPRQAVTVPPTTNAAQSIAPPSNPPAQQAQPLSRHSSSGGGGTPVQTQTQPAPPTESFPGWNNWQPQPGQAPTAARAS